MPVKIRLQRHGKKGKPFYWIVAADSRAKRDGRYLKKLGTYNPNTNPATINLDLEDTVVWLEKGAQPTDTARTLLSYKGAMIRHHLNGGIKKGALTQEEADKKFMAWLEEKQVKIQAKKDGLSKDESKAKAKRLADEKAVSEKRLIDSAAAIAEAEAVKNDPEASNDEVNITTPADNELGTPEEEKFTLEEIKASGGDVDEIKSEKEASKGDEIAPETKVPAEEKSVPGTPTPEETTPDAEEKVLEAEEESTPETPAAEETTPDAEATAEEK